MSQRPCHFKISGVSGLLYSRVKSEERQLSQEWCMFGCSSRILYLNTSISQGGKKIPHKIDGTKWGLPTAPKCARHTWYFLPLFPCLPLRLRETRDGCEAGASSPVTSCLSDLRADAPLFLCWRRLPCSCRSRTPSKTRPRVHFLIRASGKSLPELEWAFHCGPTAPL